MTSPGAEGPKPEGFDAGYAQGKKDGRREAIKEAVAALPR